MELATLPDHDLAILPDDDVPGWTAALRSGLATYTAELGGPQAGLARLWELFPDGPASAGLTERDLWARLLLRAGDHAGAMEVARARQAERDSYFPRLILLDAYLASGDPEAARREAEAVAEVARPESVALPNARGTVALAERDWAAAEGHFRDALAVRPDNVPALRGLAAALAGGGDAEGAIGILQDALQVSRAEASPGILGELRALYARQGDAAKVAQTEASRKEVLERLGTELAEELSRVREAPRSSRARRRAPETRLDGEAAPRGAGPEATASGLLARAHFDLDEVPPEALSRALFEHFGHTQFRPGQAAVLRSVLSEGRDTLALMPTGAGKSLCFQLPALVLPGVVLVISPLRALMADQLAGIAEVPGLAERATLINSTLSGAELDERLENLAAGQYSLVYVAPERLRQPPLQRALRRVGVSLLVIDEAHCLCLWGHAFRPDYLAVGQLCEQLAVPRVLAVTATATPAMQEEIAQTLGRPLTVVNTGVLRENLFLEVRQVAGEIDKRDGLAQFVRGTKGSGIVYAGSRDKCEQLAGLLRSRGVSAAYYHAGMNSADREATQQQFMSGRIRVLVATIAFGMGVNKRDVRFIVHYNPSRSLEAYTQEAGRAGRDGQPAHCLLFSTSSDKSTLTRRAHEDHLDLEALRELYARVRRAARQAGGGPIEPQALTVESADARDADTGLRVGLSALERAGFLERGRDCPREVSLLLHELPADVRERAYVEALDLTPGRAQSRSVADVARALGIAADDVEDALADRQERGILSFRPGKRGLMLRVVEPAPADGAARLEALLTSYADAAEARARALARYIEARRCRNATIARHFGEAAPPDCGRCDNCRPEGRLSAEPVARPKRAPGATTMPPREAILRLLDELPFRVGRPGIAKILRGANSAAIGPDRCRLFGALGGMSIDAIVAEVDALLGSGALHAVSEGKYTTVSLSADGHAELEGYRASE